MPRHLDPDQENCISIKINVSVSSTSLVSSMLKIVKTVLIIALNVFAATATAEEPPKIGDVLYEPQIANSGSSSRVYTLLVTQFAYPNSNYPIVEKTIDALKKLFGPDHLKVNVYSGETSDIGDADLVLSSAGTFTRMKLIGARDLASVVSDKFPDPNHAEGSVFITLKDRPDIADIASLKNKIVATTGPNAFSGYHVALGELANRGFNPDSFFSQQVSTGHDMRQVINFIRDGKADVGIVRTCFIEELGEMGWNLSDIKVVGDKTIAGRSFHCKTSTDLYPGWTIFATPRLNPEEARKVVLTLLSLPEKKGEPHWSIVSDFSSTDNLYKNLKLGPYSYLRNWTWKKFWDEYGIYVSLLMLTGVGIFGHSLRESYLVKKRTNQLRRSLQRRRETEKKARSAQFKLQELQKAGAVGQISSIIAHELRQPLATIMNYSHGLQRQLEEKDVDTDLISEGISRMQAQAEKAEQIVSKVRAYAKGEMPGRKTINLAQAATEAIKTIKDSKLSHIPVNLTVLSKEPILINADPLEIELCIVNLIKNAQEASLQGQSVEVCVNTEEGSYENDASLEVSDEGKALTEEEFEKLNEPLQSKKIEGLGLGLAIIRQIISNHKGKLIFSRRSPNGITAKMILPLEKAK